LKVTRPVIDEKSGLPAAVEWECGNLTMFSEISKGRWEGGESVVSLFPPFHRPVISIPFAAF